MKEGWNGVEKEAVRPWGRMVSGWVAHGWSGVMGVSRAVLCRVQLKTEHSS